MQEFSSSSPKRRRAEEKDEGIGSPDTLEEEKAEELRREMLELRQQLDKERSARMQLEEQVGFLTQHRICYLLHNSRLFFFFSYIFSQTTNEWHLKDTKGSCPAVRVVNNKLP